MMILQMCVVEQLLQQQQRVLHAVTNSSLVLTVHCGIYGCCLLLHCHPSTHAAPQMALSTMAPGTEDFLHV